MSRHSGSTQLEGAARLTVPVGPRDHILGPEGAEATLLEYGDYECPHCGEAYWVVKDLQGRFGARLRFAFRNFPLSMIHPHAEAAAEAAEAAGAQGRFWEMHDTLFENQGALEVDDLERYAASLGLDTRRFLSELSDRVHAPRVHDDFRSGVLSGVNGTPTFFINGARHNGSFDPKTLGAAIEDAIASR